MLLFSRRSYLKPHLLPEKLLRLVREKISDATVGREDIAMFLVEREAAVGSSVIEFTRSPRGIVARATVRTPPRL